ncbi:hypothetical protein B0T11DRAFT_135064 [Plectosphaerella cucumerina]|uniref:Uncharacterized protein n=1 Tax=Plectosphaerella cucumerina TaxID=40658 RepID=A0A8K0WYV2_9PEZI|nr:hypothetical protein B0T11DRAFT_135064 [Plectosphaerella cucumerina]
MTAIERIWKLSVQSPTCVLSSRGRGLGVMGESGPEMLGFPPTTDGPLRTPPAQVQGSAPSATFSTVGLFFFLLSAANGKLQLPRLGLAESCLCSLDSRCGHGSLGHLPAATGIHPAQAPYCPEPGEHPSGSWTLSGHGWLPLGKRRGHSKVRFWPWARRPVNRCTCTSSPGRSTLVHVGGEKISELRPPAGAGTGSRHDSGCENVHPNTQLRTRNGLLRLVELCLECSFAGRVTKSCK